MNEAPDVLLDDGHDLPPAPANRREFDTVSAIARVTGRAWNTVDRWLRRACEAAGRFLDRRLR